MILGDNGDQIHLPAGIAKRFLFFLVSLLCVVAFPWVCDSVMEVQNVTDSILLVRYFVKFSVVFWPKRYNHRSAMAS